MLIRTEYNDFCHPFSSATRAALPAFLDDNISDNININVSVIGTSLDIQPPGENASMIGLRQSSGRAVSKNGFAREP
jgi:hypothetical protein